MHTIHKHARRLAQTARKKVHTQAHDPAPASNYYFNSLATTATPVPEHVVGEKYIKALYHPCIPASLRKVLLKLGTKIPILHPHKKDIAPFIATHAIDMSDFLHTNTHEYPTFNEFFHRPLKAGVRKIDLRQTIVASPADGKLRVLPELTQYAKFFIKQQPFDLAQFLNNAPLAHRYTGGSLLVFRLAPTDYHRFHFPFDCIPTKPEFIQGDYETVNPIANQKGLWPICHNKRALIQLQSETFGTVLMVVIGAAMISSLNFVYTPDMPVKKGMEAGYFAHGGSTVCLLFKKNTLVLPDILITRSHHAKPDAAYTTTTATHEKKNAFESAVCVGQGVAMRTPSSEVNLLSDPMYISFLNKKTPGLRLELSGIVIPYAYNEAGHLYTAPTLDRDTKKT